MLMLGLACGLIMTRPLGSRYVKLGTSLSPRPLITRSLRVFTASSASPLTTPSTKSNDVTISRLKHDAVRPPNRIKELGCCSLQISAVFNAPCECTSQCRSMAKTFESKSLIRDSSLDLGESSICSPKLTIFALKPFSTRFAEAQESNWDHYEEWRERAHSSGYWSGEPRLPAIFRK